MSTRTLSWADVCAIPWLKDIPAKIETNKHNKIIMSPASNWHGGSQYVIGKALDRLLPGGRVIMECPIETSDGTRVADVAWMSKERHQPYRRAFSLPIAPEICVEVLSPSNNRQEMLEKMQLYYAAGASEVWLCDEHGNMEFFVKSQLDSVPRSVMCPDFPLCIEED
ncbi:MAG: Uma2 family endonuclease [Verrucomicrobiaceae bacterium]|nr:Uma2 family endonuclease [Verrucomicrobiaceae bacterium]